MEPKHSPAQPLDNHESVSEDRFKALFWELPIPTYIWQHVNGEFVLRDYNKAAWKMTGGDIIHLVGLRAATLFRDEPQILTDLQSCFTRREPVFREMLHHRITTGQEKSLNVSYVFVLPDLIIVHKEDVTERREAEAALHASEQKYEQITDHIEDVLWLVTPHSEIYVNPAYEKVWGRTRQSLYDDPDSWLQAVHPEDRPLLEAALQKQFESGYDVEYRIVRPDGEIRFIHDRAFPIRDEANRVFRMTGIARDTTLYKQAQAQARLAEQRFRVLIENSTDLISIHERNGIIRYQSPSIRRLLGYEPTDLVNQSVFDLLKTEDIPIVRAAYRKMLSRPEETVVVQIAFPHKNGSWRYFECTGANMLDDPSVAGFVINSRDITERRQAEERLMHNAFYDSLTGLANRFMLMDYLRRNIVYKKRHPEFAFAVLYLDLDRFKVINDSLGHTVGDKLLFAVAQRLKKSVRPEDIIARLGGDEFAVILNGVPELAQASHVAERIQSDLARVFRLEGHSIFITSSIGLVWEAPGSSGSRRRAETVLRDADLVMYRAKSLGKNRYEIFGGEMHAHALKQLRMESALRSAVEKAKAGKPEFEIHYQPIVSLQTGQLESFEALVRWHHPEQGLLVPGEFITLAEETGLIIEIGWWVLQESCLQMKRWRTELAAMQIPFPPCGISVNFSGKQFHQSDLVERIETILRAAELEPERLKMEITESSLMDNSVNVSALLQKIKALGVQISMDDFGTGYSSLSYLHRLPIDILKIDRSFIMRLGADAESSEIVRAILSLSETLTLRVIAEGVETIEHKTQLERMGCHYGQGYLWSKPVNAQEARAFLLRPDTADVDANLV